MCKVLTLWLLVTVLLVDIASAYEPRITCFDCKNCTEHFQSSARVCDARYFYCVYMEFYDGVIDRLCGGKGNCSMVLPPKTKCAMCSADLCNDVYRSSGVQSAALLVLIANTIICAVLFA